MKKYADVRYNNYQRDYLDKDTKGQYLELLPDGFDIDSISTANSLVINADTGNMLCAFHIDVAKSLDFQRFIRSIEYNEYNCIFQIVRMGNVFYVNPHFVQLPEILMKRRVRLGQIKPYQRQAMVKLQKLLEHNTLEPVEGGVCVVGTWNKKSAKQEEAERMNNTMISVGDYVEYIMTSSISAYIG